MKKGFTLIELMVVVLVIGILATLAIVNLTSAREKSRDTKRRGDMKSLGTVLEAYYNDNASYPGIADGVIRNITNLESALAPKYLVAIPKDPLNDAANGFIYEYVRDTADMSYGLYVKYESTNTPCVTGVNIKAANTTTSPWKVGVNKCTE